MFSWAKLKIAWLVLYFSGKTAYEWLFAKIYSLYIDKAADNAKTRVFPTVQFIVSLC